MDRDRSDLPSQHAAPKNFASARRRQGRARTLIMILDMDRTYRPHRERPIDKGILRKTESVCLKLVRRYRTKPPDAFSAMRPTADISTGDAFQ